MPAAILRHNASNQCASLQTHDNPLKGEHTGFEHIQILLLLVSSGCIPIHEHVGWNRACYNGTHTSKIKEYIAYSNVYCWSWSVLWNCRPQQWTILSLSPYEPNHPRLGPTNSKSNLLMQVLLEYGFPEGHDNFPVEGCHVFHGNVVVQILCLLESTYSRNPDILYIYIYHDILCNTMDPKIYKGRVGP